MKYTLLLILFIVLIESTRGHSQDINFSTEYNRISWPVNLGVGGGIIGDDGSYKRIAIYHGNSISLQTGNNQPNIANSRLFINDGGNVGMGTIVPSPNGRLTVYGGGLDIGGSGTTTDASLHIKTAYGNLERLTQIHPSLASKHALNLMASTDASLNYNWWSWGVLTSGSWALQPSSGFGGTTGLFIDRNGNVSIGNTSPDAKLAVSGQVHATEVKVTIAVPGPDYVFEPTYTLPSLDSVQSYINQNKHLPEVPSAKEMAANGVNLGEMNMLLLKKVEELTLYTIEMDKKVNQLLRENDERSIENALQQKEIAELKTRNK